MNSIKKILLSSVLLFGINSVAKADCGTITIAEMNWASAEMFAHVDKLILEEGYGCDVELVPGDTMPTATSMMEKGEPDVAPELWINSVRIALDAAVDEGRLHYAAEVLSDTGEEGWWIPQYLADANPDIVTVEDALARPELFPHPEGDGAALYTCPSGWNCQISTGNLFQAYDAESKGFNLVDPGSQEGCEDPQKNSWVVSSVFTVVTDNFMNSTGPGMDYISKRALPNSTVNALLAWKDDNQATGEDTAIYFLQNYSEWKSWVNFETMLAA